MLSTRRFVEQDERALNLRDVFPDGTRYDVRWIRYPRPTNTRPNKSRSLTFGGQEKIDNIVLSDREAVDSLGPSCATNEPKPPELRTASRLQQALFRSRRSTAGRRATKEHHPGNQYGSNRVYRPDFLTSRLVRIGSLQARRRCKERFDNTFVRKIPFGYATKWLYYGGDQRSGRHLCGPCRPHSPGHSIETSVW